jgi:hypothetical protein
MESSVNVHNYVRTYLVSEVPSWNEIQIVFTSFVLDFSEVYEVILNETCYL